jgi:hypothetical protein
MEKLANIIVNANPTSPFHGTNKTKNNFDDIVGKVINAHSLFSLAGVCEILQIFAFFFETSRSVSPRQNNRE